MEEEKEILPELKLQIKELNIETSKKNFIPEWFQHQFGKLLNEIIKMHFIEFCSDKPDTKTKPEGQASEKQDAEYVDWDKTPDCINFEVSGYIRYLEKTKIEVLIQISKDGSIKFSRKYSSEIDEVIDNVPEQIENISDFVRMNCSQEFNVVSNVNYNQFLKEIIKLIEENKDDNSIEKHFVMGMFLAKAGQEEQALENLDFVINNGSNAEMVQDCYKLVLNVKARKNMKDLDSAQNEVYNGDPAKAVLLIESLINITPKYIHLHFLLGTAYKKIGQVEKSIESFKRALEIDPDHVPSFRELAEELISLGKLEEAEAMYRRIIELGQANAIDYYNLGMSLKRLGRGKELDEIIEKIKELDTEGKLDSYIFNLFDMKSDLLKDDSQTPKKQSFFGRLFSKK